MEYTQEVIDRIRKTRDLTGYRKIGAELAVRWISEEATFQQIKDIAELEANLPGVNKWIRDQCQGGTSLETYFGFRAEVKRFWHQTKGQF